MEPLKLTVLTPEQFQTLYDADPNGYYESDQRDRLTRIVTKLKSFRKNCSRTEIALLKKFQTVVFAWHLPRGEATHGPIRSEGRLLLEGKHEGDMDLGQSLVVESCGELTGKVHAASVVCRGKIKGDINSPGLVRIHAGGEVEGEIVATSIQIEEGSRFKGDCRLIDPPKTARPSPWKGS